MRNYIITLTAVSALALAGCASKGPKELPPQPQTVAEAPPPPEMPSGPVPGSNADFLSQMQGRNVIYFDTDKYDIDAQDAAACRASCPMTAPDTKRLG